MTITSAQAPLPDRREPRRGQREPFTYARRRQARASHPRRRPFPAEPVSCNRFVEELESRARRLAVRELKRGARTIIGEDRSRSLHRFGLFPQSLVDNPSNESRAIVIASLRNAVAAGQHGIAAGRWSACPVRPARSGLLASGRRCWRNAAAGDLTGRPSDDLTIQCRLGEYVSVKLLS
jgi:hypothetical protein